MWRWGLLSGWLGGGDEVIDIRAMVQGKEAGLALAAVILHTRYESRTQQV
jgi:hypothetical protein